MSNKITIDELHPSLQSLINQGGGSSGGGTGTSGSGIIASPTPPTERTGLWIDTSK